MQDYLDAIVRPLLKKPDSFSVVESMDNLGVLLTIDVAPEDMGILIGKQGNHITAVRKLITVYGMRNNARISVKVNEPVGGKYHGAE